MRIRRAEPVPFMKFFPEIRKTLAGKINNLALKGEVCCFHVVVAWLCLGV
jgi:hypothetical protein